MIFVGARLDFVCGSWVYARLRCVGLVAVFRFWEVGVSTVWKVERPAEASCLVRARFGSTALVPVVRAHFGVAGGVRSGDVEGVAGVFQGEFGDVRGFVGVLSGSCRGVSFAVFSGADACCF